MPTVEKDLPNLPEDSASLKAMLRSLLAERDREKQRAEEQCKRAKRRFASGSAVRLGG